MTSLVRLIVATALPILASSACAAAQQRTTPPAATLTPFDAPRHVDLPASGATVPLTKEGEFYFATVRLNGQPFRFTLETGAGFLAISTGAARALGLRVDSVAMPIGPTSNQLSAVVHIDSLSLGDATFRGLTARVTNMWDGRGFDGIISIPLLRGVLATLDLGGKSLVLRRGSLGEPNGRDIVPIVGRDRGGRIDVPLQLGDVSVPVVIDTRSFIAIVVPDSLESAIRFQEPPRFIGQAAGPSLGTFRLRGAKLAQDGRFGNAVIQRPQIALRDRPGAVIGVPLLEQVQLTLDIANGRAQIVRPSGAPVILAEASAEPSAQSSRAASTSAPAGTPGQRTLGFNLAGYPGSNRLNVVNLVPGSDAEKAGLKNNDALIEFDGVPAAQMNPTVFRAAVARGDAVKIVVSRDDKQLTFFVKSFVP
jgi:hypothetical protein